MLAAQGFEVKTLDSHSDALGYDHCAAKRSLWKQDDKLLAAKASHHIVATRVVRQNVGHQLEDVIAHIVPISVIDLLKEVDVEHHYRNGSLSPAVTRHILWRN